MSLSRSNAKIAKKLYINEPDCNAMDSLLRESLCEKHPQEILEGIVEFDILYIVAAHKGYPESV